MVTPYTVWIEVADSEDVPVFIDLNAVRSTFQCVYGCGCQGMRGNPVEGCCTVGPTLWDREEAKHIRKSIAKLTPKDWERHGTKKLIKDKKRPLVKTVEGACVFLNRGEKAGCAFHHLAKRTGKDVFDLKPEVCSTVPWYLHDEEAGLFLTNMKYLDWGGSGWSWFCFEEGVTTGEPFAGSRIAWITYEREIRFLIGDDVYDKATPIVLGYNLSGHQVQITKKADTT
jgi:hypothetical protein